MDYKELKETIDILEKLPDGDRDKMLKLVLTNKSVEQEKPVVSYKQKGLIEKDGDGLYLKLTTKEIKELPMRFRREFYIRDKLVRCYRRQCSEKTVNYEIRYRKNGYNIYASSNDLEEAKRKFIEQLWSADARRDARFPAMARARRRRTYDYDRWDDYYDDDEDFGVPETFHKFAMYYFEKYRKRKVSELTYTNDMYKYNKHLKPYFGDMRLKAIRPDMCQELLDDLQERGLGKTNNEIHSILNNIMKNALAHGVIKRNPMAIVIVEKHKSTHGKALTKQEEKTLLEGVKGTRYEVAFALALYTGLRPNEYYTARIEGDFIVAKNSKRKGGKIEYKKIPIIKKFKPYLEGVTEFDIPNICNVRDKFNSILAEHILYDLRRTFYTRCDECGVSMAARDEFVGHSGGALTDAYRDLSDEYLLKEAEKLDW